MKSSDETIRIRIWVVKAFPTANLRAEVDEAHDSNTTSCITNICSYSSNFEGGF